MQEADRVEWNRILNRHGDLVMRKLPEATAAVWWEELKPYHLLVVEEAYQKARVNHKQQGWFPFALLETACKEVQLEANRAEENARKMAELKRAAETRGGDGLGFVHTGEGGEFGEKQVTILGNAIYVVSQTQEGRDWLANQVCCKSDGTTPKMLDGAWNWRKPLELWQVPRPKEVCQKLAQCLGHAVNLSRSEQERAEVLDYAKRIVGKARGVLSAKPDGKLAAAGE